MDDVGRSLSWDALGAFVQYDTLTPSALLKELDEEHHQWATTAQTNYLLADIYDLLAVINENLKIKGTKARGKMPKPHPRPGDKKKATKKIGTAMPAAEFDAWLKNKRGESNGKRK
jgi:hypothetical protein